MESQATALRGEVRSGAHIHDDVEELKRSLQAERGMAAEVQAAYEHEEAQAKLEKQRLETRIMQLQLRKAEDNRTRAAGANAWRRSAGGSRSDLTRGCLGRSVLSCPCLVVACRCGLCGFWRCSCALAARCRPWLSGSTCYRPSLAE